MPAPEDGQAREGQRLTQDAPHNSSRPPPPGMAPHHLRGTQPPQGAPAKGTVLLDSHGRTPAPTARGWRTPTACPEGGHPGKGGRLTSDAPHSGDGHPPRGALSRRPHSAQRRPARATVAGSPRPHQPHPGHSRGTPAARPRGWAAKGGTAPDTGRPSQRGQATPSRNGPHRPCGTQPPQGTHAQGTVLGPHTRAPAPAARG